MSQIISVARQFCLNSALMWTDLVCIRLAALSTVSLLVNRLISRFISMFTREKHYKKENDIYFFSFNLFSFYIFQQG